MWLLPKLKTCLSQFYYFILIKCTNTLSMKVEVWLPIFVFVFVFLSFFLSFDVDYLVKVCSPFWSIQNQRKSQIRDFYLHTFNEKSQEIERHTTLCQSSFSRFFLYTRKHYTIIENKFVLFKMWFFFCVHFVFIFFTSLAFL